MNLGLDLAVALLGTLINLVALVVALRPGLDRDLKCVRVYLTTIVVSDPIVYAVFWKFGYTSSQYKLAYYGTDLATTIAGFYTIARLVEVVLKRSTLKVPGLRAIIVFTFSGITVGSAFFAYYQRGLLTTAGFAQELEQNFAFLAMVLAVLLLTALNTLQVSGVIHRRVALAFSLFYSSDAIIYSLIALLPSLYPLAFYGLPIINLIGSLLIAYSLWDPKPKSNVSPAPAMAPVSGASW